MPSITHANHYVPIWYQKRFLGPGQQAHYRLDLAPPTIELPDGRTKRARALESKSPKASFVEHDLYTTMLGGVPNDEIERYLFGAIDNDGAKAVRAFAENDMAGMHSYFQRFFEYLSAQKLRTPKGLDWIRGRYPTLSQIELMVEMQALRRMHCTMWFECVREIVSGEASEVKFIVTDHPVTAYNAACPPNSQMCQYPGDPPISLIGTQTLCALDSNHCLILTNLEYAEAPDTTDLLKDRQNARYSGRTIARTDKLIRTRKLARDEVIAVNHVLKSRARRYVAAGEREWLQPETSAARWNEIGEILLPPKNELWGFGGEIYIGYKDGSVEYQDAFGRTSRSHEYLRKEQRATIGPNDLCGCGSGRKFKKCCGPLALDHRLQWSHYSIRERNIILINAITDILGLDKGKKWDDVRRELSDEQVKRIHEVFESGWPEDTNLVDLLPRPDERVLRATYMGIIDVRTIGMSITGWLAYFDEIVLVHPFANPNHIRPEYSPIQSPGQHKSQTLKNVFLLLTLEPFIRAGIVHLVPDPGDVNIGFGWTALRMARERGADWEPTEEDMRLGMSLAKDDLKRSTLRMSDDSLRNLIRESRPGISAELVERTLSFMKSDLQKDPFALLQPATVGEAGAELVVQRGVSLESALFLAQTTGSTIYTDSRAHWGQLNSNTRDSRASHADSAWSELLNAASAAEYTTDLNPEISRELRASGELSYVRHCFRRVWNTVKTPGVDPRVASKLLARRLQKAAERTAEEWQKCTSAASPSKRVRWAMELSVPPDGFSANTVHRLLVTFGSASYLQTVPMALFVRPVRVVEDGGLGMTKGAAIRKLRERRRSGGPHESGGPANYQRRRL